jgi:nucleoside-diphosphate-sugar epimerase
MKVLFIGGTGLISSACSQRAVELGMELYLLTRGKSTKFAPPAGAHVITGDISGDPAALATALGGHTFDSVVNWIAYKPADVERDIKLFGGRTRQYVFISSASAYQKPSTFYRITEDTPLANPYWSYSRDKIACEERALQEYRSAQFPITIVRPSLTYGPSNIPLAVGSWAHPFTVIDRMRRGKKVIVPGDGTSLWTCTWNGDFAKAFCGLLGREEALGHAFHITSDETLTWNQLYTIAAHAAGAEPNLIHIASEMIAAHYPETTGGLIGDKAVSVVFDNSKIKRFVPGFVATVSWSEGVRRALAWFEADAARRTIDADANQRWDALIAAYERALPEIKR